jgi:hypothetical protein
MIYLRAVSPEAGEALCPARSSLCITAYPKFSGEEREDPDLFVHPFPMG